MMLATGLSCLVVAYAGAQPGQPDRPPTQPRPGAGTTSQPTMNQGMPQQTTMRGENSEVDQYFAACLTNKNQGEVEIGKFAAERAQNQQVKQFAQMMVSDHQAMLPKLQQLTGTQFNTERQGGIQRTSFEGQPNQPGGDQQSPLGTAGQQPAGASGVTGQPGRQPTGTPQFGEPGGSQQAGQPGMPGQPGQSPTQSGIANRMGGEQAIHQLIAIDRQIAENCTRNLREKLQEKQGAEFDMCYIGSQVAAHAEMLSALEVLKNQTSGQLKQLVQEAEPKVKQHLEQAEKIAEQLKDSSPNRQADAGRTNETPRVPR